jgi:AAA+ ATPase superfamily predicted ATPase
VLSDVLIDRERELSTLVEAADAPGGQLVVLWGRRRTGKTYLLQAFCRERRSVYYTATQQSAPVELASFTDAVREGLGDEGLPPGYAFPDWAIALDFVTRAAGDRRLVVVIDELPYLGRSSPGIESVLQRWWDRRGRRGPVMLVLCGSAVAHMQAILGAAAPLHQRATATIHLTPLDYRAAGLFLRKATPTDRALAYGILGGTPLYLEQWSDRASVRDNLVRLFGRPTSPLVDAAELVLSGELPETEGHFRILQAVAFGRTQPKEIGEFARVATERPLKRLTTLGILERRVPAFDDPERSRRAIYRIRDPYFAFWFRFVAPSRAHIARGLGTQLVDNTIMPGLDDHMGGVFEEIAREHARDLAARGELIAEQVASWWSPDGQHEIDLVGVTGGKRVGFIGTVKWSRRPLSRSVLAELDAHAESLAGYSPATPRLVYSRGGCGASVAAMPNVRCFSLPEMYGQ